MDHPRTRCVALYFAIHILLMNSRAKTYILFEPMKNYASYKKKSYTCNLNMHANKNLIKMKNK